MCQLWQLCCHPEQLCCRPDIWKELQRYEKIFTIKFPPPVTIIIYVLLALVSNFYWTLMIFFTNNWFKMSRFYNRIVVANYHSKCSFCWQKTIKKRSHFGLFVHQGFTVLRHLWRFCEYLWREGSRPESPLFIGLPEQMWRVNPRFLLYTHTRKKINKERKQLYG